MLNAAVMGIAGSVTVRTGREFFGDDQARLRRVGTLFATCGLFILFGSILLRDCFTTLLNAVVLWGLARWLLRPSTRSLIVATALTTAGAYAMLFVREQASSVFGLLGTLAFPFWFFGRRLSATRLVAAIGVVCLLLVAAPYLPDYAESFRASQDARMNAYVDVSVASHSDDSLGMRFVVNQPLPIRMVMGSALMLINPIPLWKNFRIGADGYEWINGYHGIYQALVFPMAIAGLVAVAALFRVDRQKASALLFLVSYQLVNMGAVVATSGEQRHLAQFMPAFMILAALPDPKDPAERSRLRKISLVWWTVIILVHLVWMKMKNVV
jgi:hypothetical protein